jgi:hypothetical protein
LGIGSVQQVNAGLKLFFNPAKLGLFGLLFFFVIQKEKETSKNRQTPENQTVIRRRAKAIENEERDKDEGSGDVLLDVKQRNVSGWQVQAPAVIGYGKKDCSYP